ncbi:uncharacterized protein LOC129589480 [Paramacrobiotus metropolitanus]|uniref:uncharacterized protein LOC129589480 n=1 Tax=Paramacrobiotus metropolitanus TaxID=2943436 RepID=UPI002445A416|nr:uncharacterized protein LOC129589480 [Paramacrobiotus metropolitanus]
MDCPPSPSNAYVAGKYTTHCIMYLCTVSAILQLIAAFIGLLPLGIPCRMNPPARYRSGHFLMSVFAACLMVIAAVSYGIVLSTLSKDADYNRGVVRNDIIAQRTRDLVFTFRILLSLLIILLLGALINLAVVIAVCTAVRKCYRNCKV